MWWGERGGGGVQGGNSGGKRRGLAAVAELTSAAARRCLSTAAAGGGGAGGGGAARTSIVIGGGFIGLSCAIHLQRLGRRVILLDRSAIGGGQAASFGNAGTFCVYANVPVNNPSIMRRLPGMLLDPTGPLSLRLSPHLPTMLPWAALFGLHCRPKAVEHTAKALGELLSRAEQGYDPVFEHANIDVDGEMGGFASGPGDVGKQGFARRDGYLLCQKTEEVMRGSQAGAALRRLGLGGALRMEQLSKDEVLSLEPNLSPNVCGGGAWFFPDAWFLNEPGAMLRALASGFESAGGEIRDGVTANFIRTGGGGDKEVVAALTGGGLQGSGGETEVFRGHEVVIAAGAHSKALVQGLGEWCPLDTERGYHVGFGEGSEKLLTRAVCDPSQGLIASPMAGGMRIAGKVELGGLNAGPTTERYENIEVQSRAMISGLGQRSRAADWMGFRPTMPDALPVIGRSRNVHGVFYAFGHHHVGWTLGGVTGSLVADMVEGKKPRVDLEPYSLRRFAWF